MPKLGQTLIYRTASEETKHNGHEDHPAIVTYVHSDDMVNLKVFFDCGPCEDRTSVLWRAAAKRQGIEDHATWEYD